MGNTAQPITIGHAKPARTLKLVQLTGQKVSVGGSTKVHIPVLVSDPGKFNSKFGRQIGVKFRPKVGLVAQLNLRRLSLYQRLPKNLII